MICYYFEINQSSGIKFPERNLNLLEEIQPNNSIGVDEIKEWNKDVNNELEDKLNSDDNGQSDIKKLKRENELLKKEIWCLRDEYDKLDKLLKEKEISFSSSSTTCTSETESCSTCSEDSDQVETSQNLENVQKTNLKNLHVEFDHLSVVPEENSTENSDKNSNRTSIPLENWNNEKNIIKPDQSYPSFEALTKSTTLPQIGHEQRVPKHFFAPIKTSKSCGDAMNNQFLMPTSSQTLFESHSQYFQNKMDEIHHRSARTYPLYENDPRNLTMMTPLSKSSTDLIVKMDNKNFSTLTSSSFSNGGNLEQLLNDIESISQDILKLSNPNLSYNGEGEQFTPPYPGDSQTPPKPFETIPENCEVPPPNKPYKSELNVVLMPTAMPLIGFEKYRNIQTSLESIRKNPFYFGNTSSNDYFGSRYNPDNYINTNLSTGVDKNKKSEVCNSKTNLLEVNSEQVSSENEENLKFKTSKNEKDESAKIEKKIETKKPESKTPKLSIRRKVSIHFKGKKDKKNKSLDQLDVKTAPIPEKKHSLFDIKFTTTESKQKDNLQKTPSVDSKKNFIENGLDVKVSPAPDSKRNSNECKPPENASGVDTPKIQDKKSGGKSASVSPERKHVHVKEDGKKPHKKHKKNDKKNRRSTISAEKFYNDRVLRERSFSVCTERSNMLGMGLGFNSAFSMYDDCPISDRERTNSLSSCGTIKLRKMSNMSNFPITGKIPWCACWGNGCL
ncbi:hypothetical protein MML48_9g00009089 [Holotrichia oblita]|uniref:Uncharacterized protein n=1 Tax=Holotrichia oblita TaxID=644536 RepID=A0ACB9SI75_HOLOL|nr:hypothetical protein MML48_9g00009089 [Holotrichia oblita]